VLAGTCAVGNLLPKHLRTTLEIRQEGPDASPPIEIAATGRSGGKFELTCKGEGEGDKKLLHWTFEPTIGEDGRTIDLHYDYHVPMTKSSTLTAEGKTTASDGIAALLFQNETASLKTSVSVKVNVVEFHLPEPPP